MSKSKKYSLRFVLTTLFAILILSVGGLIGVLNYTQITKLLLSAANEIYDGVSEEIVLNHKARYNPVLNSLNLLSHSYISESKTIEQRLEYMELLSSALYIGDSIAAIQLGYENGDYFIVRKLNTDELRNKFDATAETTLLVDNVEFKSHDKSILTRVFLDKNLKKIRINKPEITQYDPRKRSWYLQAGSKTKAVAPYYFYFMQQVGTTVTRKMHKSNTVIAIDLKLQDISSGLEQSKMTPGSELYLITSKGTVIASLIEMKVWLRILRVKFYLKKHMK